MRRRPKQTLVRFAQHFSTSASPNLPGCSFTRGWRFTFRSPTQNALGRLTPGSRRGLAPQTSAHADDLELEDRRRSYLTKIFILIFSLLPRVRLEHVLQEKNPRYG